MTLKNDAKFREKPICNFKHGIRNLVNFQPTTQTSENFTSISSFCPNYLRIELKILRRSYLSWNWTVMQNLNKPWECCFKTGTRIGRTFIRVLKNLKNCTLMGSVIQTYNASATKLYVMTLKGYPKFKRKLTLGLRNDKRNLVGFLYWLMVSICPKYI